MNCLVKQIKNLILIIIGMCIGGYIMAHKYCKKLNEYRAVLDKHQYWIRLYDIWVLLKQSSINIEKYLNDKNINSIAIYGASFLGIRLYHELKNTRINVKYILDKNPGIKMFDITVKNPDTSEYEEVDAVIVTALYTYDDIKMLLTKKGYKQVIAFDEMLYEMMKDNLV